MGAAATAVWSVEEENPAGRLALELLTQLSMLEVGTSKTRRYRLHGPDAPTCPAEALAMKKDTEKTSLSPFAAAHLKGAGDANEPLPERGGASVLSGAGLLTGATTISESGPGWAAELREGMTEAQRAEGMHSYSGRRGVLP